jgi:hypothetical protein
MSAEAANLITMAVAAKAPSGKHPWLVLSRARGVNLEGDEADRKAHGGPDKAIYAYAVEDLRWCGQTQVGARPQCFDKRRGNILSFIRTPSRQQGTRGSDTSKTAVPTSQRSPTSASFTIPSVVRFSPNLPCCIDRPIVAEGDLSAGNEIHVVEKPNRNLTIRDIFRIYTRDPNEIERLLAVPRISESWKKWASHFRNQKQRPGPSEIDLGKAG